MHPGGSEVELSAINGGLHGDRAAGQTEPVRGEISRSCDPVDDEEKTKSVVDDEDADDEEFTKSAPFSFRRQLRALLWRHWLLKTRLMAQTLTEVFSPIVLLCLLVLAYSLSKGEEPILTPGIY